MGSQLASGLAPLDEALGGLPAGSLVQIHGPPAAGKTTLGLVLARANPPCGLILPERPSGQRLRAVLGELGQRVLVAKPTSFEAQAATVERACRLLAGGKVACLLLDSLSYRYRFEQMATTEALRELILQLHRLREAARDSGGLAVFTNQVRGGPQGPRPLGGPAIGHASDVILGLSVLDGAWRRLRLEKHPSRPSGASWDVRITEAGMASGV